MNLGVSLMGDQIYVVSVSFHTYAEKLVKCQLIPSSLSKVQDAQQFTFLKRYFARFLPL